MAGIVPFVDLVAQYESIADEIEGAFHEVTASAQYILGARVERFEQEFAEFVGAAHAVGWEAVSTRSASVSWHSRSGPDDEVILPANTYIATALAVSEVGATVVLVDCDPASHNSDPSAVAAAMRSKRECFCPYISPAKRRRWGHYSNWPRRGRPWRREQTFSRRVRGSRASLPSIGSVTTRWSS